MIECRFKERCKKYKDSGCPENFCLKLFKIDSLCDNALLTQPQRQHINLKLDADGSDREAFIELKNIESNIEDFVNKGKNLYIYSSICGNGKSSWSLRLLNSYIQHTWATSSTDDCKGLFINVPKFLISLKDNISQKSPYIEHIKANVLKADLVIWDDIATKGFTQFEMENVLNIINNRIEEGKSNIYTSNMIGEELQNAIGNRLYSRIVNFSQVITFVGQDKRGLQ